MGNCQIIHFARTIAPDALIRANFTGPTPIMN